MTKSLPDSSLEHRLDVRSDSTPAERLSLLVGDVLWRQGWLLDRAKLFDRCFARSRRRSLSQPLPDAQIKKVVVEVGEGMLQDILAEAPASFEMDGFASHLASLLGLTAEEAVHAQGRFHRLALQDRQAFLSLVYAPKGRKREVPQPELPVGFEGLLDDPSGRLARGAERALLALFDMEDMHVEGNDHD